MTEPAANYTPLDLRTRNRARAARVWIITLAGVLAWVVLIAGAPVLASSGLQHVSSPVYNFFSYICHQIPERSLHLAGHQMAVCSRCFGVYFGLLAGIAIYPLWRGIDETEPVSKVWLFLSLIPITIDWSLTVFGVWENTHISRFITGIVLGAVCATYIVPALADITGNLAARRVTARKLWRF